jgi:hypothetical protein
MSIDPRLLEFCITENQRTTIQAVIDHGSQRAAAKELNKAHGTIANTVQSIKKRAEKRGYSPEHDLTHILPESLTLKGTSTLYHKEKGQILQWVKTQADKEVQAQQILEAIKDALEEYRGKSEPVHHVGFDPVNGLTAYVMGDAHFGMLAHQDETKIDDFDSEIAYRIMQGAVDYLVHSSPPTKNALFVNVGDALHVDNRQNKTPGHGHPLDADSRYYRIIKVFVWAMIHAIRRMLEKHDFLTVINAAGNHDPDSTQWIQLALALYFDNEPRVDIIQDPGHYYRYRYENVLLGVTHGDGAKMEELPNIMAHLWAQEWGQTIHRHWITGHIHHKTVKEFNGCKVESFNTLAPSDAWHAKSGYFAAREMHSMIFHPEHGLVARNICPVGLAHN